MIADDEQLDLFAEPRPTAADQYRENLAELTAVAAAVPPTIRFGTSSWTFPGWAGLVYQRRYRNNAEFVAESLAEYGRHPLLRTVGIDRSYYAPVPEDDFRTYASQVPADFRFTSKVWSEITTRVFADHPRNGARAGQPNPNFLSVDLFRAQVLRPAEAGLGAKLGPIILEFPPERGSHDGLGFARALDRFFTALDTTAPMAVEVREPAWMTRAYFDVLRAHRVGHVFNFWSRMPSLAAQYRAAQGFSAAHVVLRLMLPPGRKYEALKEAWAPFDRIVEPQPAMRKEALAIIVAAEAEDREVDIIVNNKAEGCSPLTVIELAKALARIRKKG